MGIRLFLFIVCFASVSTPRSAAVTPQIHDPIELDHGFRYHDWQDYTLGVDLLIDGDMIFFSYGLMHDGYPQRGIRTNAMGQEIDPSTYYLQPCDT